MPSGRVSQQIFTGVVALLFVGSAAATLGWSASMSEMGEMAMPGGWTMSMTWMRMPGQSWAGAAAAFVAMWTVMMVAMMLPSLVPMLERSRRAGMPAALVAAGYFTVWSALGVAVFPIGVALTAAEMRVPALARVVPIGAGVVVVLGGVVQLSAWKARHLRWEHAEGKGAHPPSADAPTAWSHGLRLGLHCVYCCAGLTASFLALGVMDLRAMLVVTVAITAERFAPAGARVARAFGFVAVAAGSLMIARAIGLV